MKPRKISRRVTVTAQEDTRDRLVVSITVDDSPSHAAPALHGDTSQASPQERKRVSRPRRGSTKQPKATP